MTFSKLPKARNKLTKFLICGAIIVVVLSSTAALYLRLSEAMDEIQTLKEQNDALAQTVAELQAQTAELEAVLNDPGNGVNKHGKLRVEGTRLLDQDGNAVQLRGMSSHGLYWYPEYINAGALKTLKERGANLFRAAMYADSSYDGYNHNEFDKKFNETMLYLAVENALAEDMYVIADWHILIDKTPLKNMDAAVDFFKRLSKRFANEPGVIYEICNEPNGDTTWSDIKRYADTVIPVIRANSPDAIIIVGTPHFSMYVNEAAASPLKYTNIMYTYHVYISSGNNSSTWSAADKAIKAGLPVFVSEWGVKTDGQGKYDFNAAEKFLSFLDKNNISWVNWSLSNKAEDHAAIRPEVTKTSGWTDADLTESGKFIFSHFNKSKEDSK
jgi:aryl-phospho-beta-D-glucosidase BglC (GH1 family)